MNSYEEILFCRNCNSEYELVIINDEIISQSPCKCPKLKVEEKLLDKFAKELGEYITQLKSKEKK